MTSTDVVISSEQMTPRQVVAKLSTIGVTASVSVMDNTATGERIEGVVMNFRELADALTSGKYGLPEALEGLVRSAAARTLTKSPVFLKGMYFSDIAHCVLGWGAAFLIATGEDRTFYLDYLYAARKATVAS